MVKHTHGENGIRSEEWGLREGNKNHANAAFLRKSCTFIEIFFRNRLTKSRRDGKIYRQSAVAVKIESGRVPEWPMGTDCKSAAFQLRWFESTRAHQKTSTYESTLRFLFCMCVKLTNAGGFEQLRRCRRRQSKNSPARDIHPRPPRDPVSEPGTGFSVL